METTWPTLNDVMLTSLRWLGGLGTGALIGFVIALLEVFTVSDIQQSDRNNSSLMAGLLDFLRAIPVIALVPVVQMFGVNEWWKISLIAWASTFPIWLSIRQARSKQMIDLELGLNANGLKSMMLFRVYRFPKALVGLIKGIEISIGVAWISVVASELVGTYSNGFWSGGLGYKVNKAHDANNWGGMLVCLVLFGLLGSSTSVLWRYLSLKGWRFISGFNPMYEYGD